MEEIAHLVFKVRGRKKLLVLGENSVGTGASDTEIPKEEIQRIL